MDTQLLKTVPSAYFVHLNIDERGGLWLNLAHVTEIYHSQDSNGENEALLVKTFTNKSFAFKGEDVQTILTELEKIRAKYC